jgi:transcriptional regulator with XRE-family HTH domain
MLETGRNFVTSDTLEKLAAALEIPVFELFVTKYSPRDELDQLRQDIVKEIKKEINQTVSKAIKESFAEEFYKNKKK